MFYPMDIEVLVREFYALEAISAMLSLDGLSNIKPMKHSHAKFLEDFHAFRDKYISQFAAAIFDYTVLVVAAELRHCKGRSDRYLIDYYTAYNSNRNEVFSACTIYNPYDILNAGKELFSDRSQWARSYGGAKWCQITEAGLRRKKLHDCVFIDHCVDLSHNCSVYFDKGAGIFCLDRKNTYVRFLDERYICTPEALLEKRLGREFNKLLKRLFTLQIIEPTTAAGGGVYLKAYYDQVEESLFEYKPIEWGFKQLSYLDSNIGIGNYRVLDERRRDL